MNNGRGTGTEITITGKACQHRYTVYRMIKHAKTGPYDSTATPVGRVYYHTTGTGSTYLPHNIHSIPGELPGHKFVTSSSSEMTSPKQPIGMRTGMVPIDQLYCTHVPHGA